MTDKWAALGDWRWGVGDRPLARSFIESIKGANIPATKAPPAILSIEKSGDTNLSAPNVSSTPLFSSPPSSFIIPSEVRFGRSTIPLYMEIKGIVQ